MYRFLWRSHDCLEALSGRLIEYRQTGTMAPWSNRQNLSFEWDLNGNLWKRIDVNQSNLTEEFFYDAPNRLDYSELDGDKNLDLTLDAIGNITSKTSPTNPAEDVGTYTYHATRKHAVVSTSNGWSFGYDANGNMNSYKGNSIGWTSYNLPSSINGAGQSSQFAYGPNRNRWRQIASYPSGTETTIYVGGILEKVTVPSGTAYRHYIGAGSAQVIYTRWTTGTITTKYVTADHLGSSTVVMDGFGGTLVNLSFGSYGARRGSAWTGSPTAGDWTQIANSTRQGFTGHEQLDAVNFVHMNGRVFEPVLGRFISADPFMPGSLGSQAMNRYAYVGNRPQSLVDPTGFEDVTTSQSGPRVLPQCPYQIANIAVDCNYSYGWRNDLDPYYLWMRQEDLVDAWVAAQMAVPGNDPKPPPPPPKSPPQPRYVPPEVAQENHLPCSAATSGPAGDGILIQLAYTEVIGNLNHAFVVAIDPSNGQVYASRGGPGSGPGGEAGIAFNDFVARSGPLNANFPDQLSEVHSVQTVGRINAPFASVVGYMNAFEDVTNSNDFNYWALFQNSNSYAFTLIEGLGFSRPDPAVPAPGHSTNRVDSRLTCSKP